ncbi:hypothetical protein M9H77_10885 [Catharanthus roseus]|uniref:Uncharacterized protein n=1 Tax=Catharanthus roseus TaxID=4058 RepID=A0ACC0BD13_CATRO|nr:hypothetical protein M9H77_10885 [Catharanthus roseus]
MARLTLDVQTKQSFKHKKPSSSLLCLPQELVTKIITHVAASSHTDFLATKFICKDLYKLPEQEEGHIYQHVSLENFPIVAWHNEEKHSEFFKKCQNSKNPEALYRQGVVHYFSDAKLDSAINCLKEAGNLGHLGAHYAMAIIFILCEDERRQKGISLLSEMKKSKILGKKVKECRENLKGILKMIWKNSLIVKEKPTCCTMEHLRKKNKKKMDGWSILEGEDQQVICEACCSDFEIASIIDVL